MVVLYRINKLIARKAHNPSSRDLKIESYSYKAGWLGEEICQSSPIVVEKDRMKERERQKEARW
jgi:hypothetical protein